MQVHGLELRVILHVAHEEVGGREVGVEEVQGRFEGGMHVKGCDRVGEVWVGGFARRKKRWGQLEETSE